MKKYTTLLCLLLALVMVMACFTGCAKQPAQSDPADTTEPAQTTDTTPEDSAPAEPADTRETVNIRFAQFGNNLDDLDGYANDPIKAAIAQAVGYESQSRFTAAFKETYGELPTEYPRRGS